MKDPANVFHITLLQQCNAACRQRLREEPGDAPARIRLAWCLLLQAFHQSSRQSVWRALGPEIEQAASLQTPSFPLYQPMPASGLEMDSLVRESLLQAETAACLSVHPADQADVARIRELAGLLGCEAEVAEAKQTAAARQDRCLRAILQKP